MQKGKKFHTKIRLPVCKIPSHIHAGIWSIIFGYVGVNKSLANCRLVCKKWKKYFKRFLQTLLLEKRNALASFKQEWEDLIENSSPLMKQDLNNALQLKSEYERFVELIPKKYSLFHRVSDLGKLNRPNLLLHYGIISVMYLLASKDELKKEGGRLSWNYCKKRLQDKNFIKSLKETTPEKLTHTQITMFQEIRQASLITPEQLSHESTQAQYLMEWALKVVEYRELTKNFSKEAREIIELLNVRENKQREIEKFQQILTSA